MSKQSAPPLRVLLTGATGFVGQRLYPELLERGFDVVRASRRPREAAARHGGEWVRFEAGDRQSAGAAMRSIDVVIYLVHGMSDGEGYEQREREAAFLLRDAAEQCGVKRILYLGGVEPRKSPSKHLASRLETGRILREGVVPAWELRAGMVIGEGSQSWRICRDLAMRLPLMVLPKWMQSRSQPVSIDDVTFAIGRAVDLDLEGHRLFDLPGPDTLPASEILFSVARLRNIRPVALPVPLLSPRLSSHWLRLVTGVDFSVAKELVEGLTGDLVATQPSLFATLDHQPLGFEAAAKRALEDGKTTIGARVVEGLVRRLSLSN